MQASECPPVEAILRFARVPEETEKREANMSDKTIQAIEDYLSEIGKIRVTHAGTGETSYYPPLSGLLNAIGDTLSPKVRCVIQLQNQGAGMPDGGMFTADIYLNEHCCWRNVPASVWEYTIGGYPVIKKWLSYREKALLGRGLTIDEVRYVTETARRIAALIALQPALDANYHSNE